MVFLIHKTDKKSNTLYNLSHLSHYWKQISQKM